MVKIKDILLLTRKSHIPIYVCDQERAAFCRLTNDMMLATEISETTIIELDRTLQGDILCCISTNPSNICLWKEKYNLVSK